MSVCVFVNSFWGIKFLVLVGICIGSFYIPQEDIFSKGEKCQLFYILLLLFMFWQLVKLLEM
jgi:Serine incorporator (Serinc)